CLFSMVTEAGARVDKLISWESVRQAALDIPIDSGWLPQQVIRHGTGAGGDWAVAFIPPAVTSLELITGTPGENEHIERIQSPLPAMVVFGIGVQYWVSAIKEDKPDPKLELFRCPLPNVMADGSICWGPLKAPAAGPRSILRAWNIFVASSFNNHAASGKSKQYEDIREQLKALAANSADKYPVQDLISQAARGVTLDQGLNHFFETGSITE
ncbi:MAG: hypothetical protein ACREDR_13820, partial [Blastocatellia bacterium]